MLYKSVFPGRVSCSGGIFSMVGSALEILSTICLIWRKTARLFRMNTLWVRRLETKGPHAFLRQGSFNRAIFQLHCRFQCSSGLACLESALAKSINAMSFALMPGGFVRCELGRAEPGAKMSVLTLMALFFTLKLTTLRKLWIK